jgi:hypothetical protein
MPYLFFDIETRSAINLGDAGAWHYASDPTTEVLCVGYAVDDDNPLIWTPGDPIPEAFITAAADSSWRVVAHNYMFERAVSTRILTPRFAWPEIPLERQICTMTMALVGALPGKLETIAFALGLAQGKDRGGYQLMRQMSQPLPRRKSDPPGLIRWRDNAGDHMRLQFYCVRDVELERLVFRHRYRRQNKSVGSWTPSSTSVDFAPTPRWPRPRVTWHRPNGASSISRSPSILTAKSRPSIRFGEFANTSSSTGISWPVSTSARFRRSWHTIRARLSAVC